MKNNKNSIFFALFFCLVAFETSCMEKQKRVDQENTEPAPAAKKTKQEVALLSDAQPEVCNVSWALWNHIAFLRGQSLLHNAGKEKVAKTEMGLTPLHYAALEGDVTAISALIRAGDEKNAKTIDGWTPLHLAAYFGCIPGISALIQAKADLEAKTIDGWTPLHLATAIAITVLIQAGAEKEAEDYKGRTPLDFVSQFGKIASIYSLIEAGAKKDFTFLYKHVEKDEAQVIMAFYDLGARVSLEHKSLTQAPVTHELLDFILDLKKSEKPNANVSIEERARLLFAAAKAGYDILVKRLLANPGLDRYQDKNGNTALHIVAKEVEEPDDDDETSGQLKNCANLLLLVCNLECKNAAGKTAYDEGNELFRSMVDEMRIKKALAWSLKTVGVNVTKDQVCGIPADVRKIILSYLTKHAWLPGYLLNSSTSENLKLNTLARGQKD